MAQRAPPARAARGRAAGALAPVTLHILWSTWQLSGTTLTAVTCPTLEVDTVEFQFDGHTLDTPDNYFSSGGDCAAGETDFPWTHGPGDFSLLVALRLGSFDANQTSPLVARDQSPSPCHRQVDP